MKAQVETTFWQNKKVFLTGHTGFKGSWLSLWLTSMGAKVTGYALRPTTTPSLYSILDIANIVYKDITGNICDFHSLQNAIKESNPDIVIHMAAQAFVGYSYANPIETYSTNVMGTVHLLEAARASESIKAIVVVTTDKCYENVEREWGGYRESEPMGGYDPYSSSKGCAELVTSAFRQSFFSVIGNSCAVGSARAGNVIGGGDWSDFRLIPDAIKAFESGKTLMIRNPLATRPWQHVLEPLSGYLILAQNLFKHGSFFASGWNFGPRDEDNRSVKEVVDLMMSHWGGGARWEQDGLESYHEANLLKLDCSKAHSHLNWFPRWSLEIAIEKVVDWHKSFNSQSHMKSFTLQQIDEYMNMGPHGYK